MWLVQATETLYIPVEPFVHLSSFMALFFCKMPEQGSGHFYCLKWNRIQLRLVFMCLTNVSNLPSSNAAQTKAGNTLHTQLSQSLQILSTL